MSNLPKIEIADLIDPYQGGVYLSAGSEQNLYLGNFLFMKLEKRLSLIRAARAHLAESSLCGVMPLVKVSCCCWGNFVGGDLNIYWARANAPIKIWGARHCGVELSAPIVLYGDYENILAGLAHEFLHVFDLVVRKRAFGLAGKKMVWPDIKVKSERNLAEWDAETMEYAEDWFNDPYIVRLAKDRGSWQRIQSITMMAIKSGELPLVPLPPVPDVIGTVIDNTIISNADRILLQFRY